MGSRANGRKPVTEHEGPPRGQHHRLGAGRCRAALPGNRADVNLDWFGHVPRHRISADLARRSSHRRGSVRQSQSGGPINRSEGSPTTRQLICPFFVGPFWALTKVQAGPAG